MTLHMNKFKINEEICTTSKTLILKALIEHISYREIRKCKYLRIIDQEIKFKYICKAHMQNNF